MPSTLRPPADPPVVLHAHAAAKINLALLVGERRADSFHEIVTVLQAIGLWDDLEVRLVPEGLGLEVEGEGLPPGESNLVLVAARELARRSRDLPGASFRLRKGIPVAAGLGGGSADGAAALLALDRLWRLNLPAVNLHAMAVEVGSDVPFCVRGGSRVGTGRGERLQEVPTKGALWWLVAISAESLATAEVYQRYDELGLPQPLPGRWPSGLLDALAAGDVEGVGRTLENDLEPAAFDLLPVLRAGKERLLEAGALGAVMSGSGPTLLALARDEEHSGRIARAVRPAFARVEIARGPVPGVTFG